MGYDTPTEYTHDVKVYYDEGLGPDEEPPVPTYKKVLCGDNLLGNIFYPLWRDVGCDCCAYFRGLVTGTVLMLIANILDYMVF